MMKLAVPAVLLGTAGLTLATSGAKPIAVEQYATQTVLQSVPSDQGGQIRLVLAPEGNAARYRVREQLAGVDFPNDAVGVTSAISGAVVIAEDGRVVPGSSRFVVDVTTLKSDKERRDGYIQRRTLETEQFPTVELVPKELRGLPTPLPTSGSMKFEMVGDLTVHGVTRLTTWRVSAVAEHGGFTGTATTSFRFDEFGLTKPRVAVVLSVADTIALEYDFHLIPDSGVGSQTGAQS